MRLALVTHNVIRGDGQGRVNYEIARHALGRGEEVWLVADRVGPELIALGARWIPVQPRLRQPNVFKTREFVERADRVLSRLSESVDIIHGNGYVLTRSHHVNTSHFVHNAWMRSPAHTSRVRRDLYGFYHRISSSLNAGWERQAYVQAQVTVAVSTRVREQLQQIGLPAERIRIVPNGVDLQEFHPGQGDRESLGLPAEVPVVLFVGDIRSPRKNLETVLRALSRTPKFDLVVVGATRGSPYPELAARLRLSERVHFLGYRNDLPEVMRAADLLVFPSRYEPFSLVVLEAMASGLPVITSSTVGAADLISPECGVVLSNPDAVDDLAAALQIVAADRARRTSMGQAARAIAEQNTWGRMADAYLQIYQEITV